MHEAMKMVYWSVNVTLTSISIDTNITTSRDGVEKGPHCISKNITQHRGNMAANSGHPKQFQLHHEDVLRTIEQRRLINNKLTWKY